MVLREHENADQIDQSGGTFFEHFRRRRDLFDEGCILLGYLVHLGYGLVDLTDSRALFC